MSSTDDQAAATMPLEVSSSPNEEAGGEAVVDGGTPPVDGSAATTEKEEGRIREQWFCDTRGWMMMVAAQVAAFTYQAGLTPPGRFSNKPEDKDKGNGSDDDFRKKVFFRANTTAFLTSLAIIILLMNRSFYRSFAKVTVLEIIVVLDMIGLMAAYWAGSTCENPTNVFALVLTVLLLFVIYGVYTVQLVQKLRRLFAAIQRPMPVVPTRADDIPPVPNQQDIDGGTRAPPPSLDVGLSKSELRRRDSRLVARTPGKSTMLSP